MTLARRAVSGIVFLGLLILPSALRPEAVAAGQRQPESHPDQKPEPAVSGLLASGDFALEVVWKKSLGSGYSGIAMAEGLAITMFSNGEFDNLVALDAFTGEEIWRYEIATTYRGHSGSDDGPRSTPIVDGGVVYGLGPKGNLFAVSLADGREIWSKKIEEELGARAPFLGFATTPIVEGEVLVVQTGGREGRSISGLSKKTGELLWSVGDDNVGYQSPAVLMLAGQRQVVSVSNKGMMGILPRTGEVLWNGEQDQGELFPAHLSEALVNS